MSAEIVCALSKIDAHLGSSLGVVEIMVALHHVFNCLEDKFLWDVGHQLCFSSSIVSSSNVVVVVMFYSCVQTGMSSKPRVLYLV